MTAAASQTRRPARVRRARHAVLAVVVVVAAMTGESTPHVECVMEVGEAAAHVVVVGGRDLK